MRETGESCRRARKSSWSPSLRLQFRSTASCDGDGRVKNATHPMADAATPEPVGPWRDMANQSADVVAKALLEDPGALLMGVGGTGKTRLAKAVIQQLCGVGHQVRL